MAAETNRGISRTARRSVVCAGAGVGCAVGGNTVVGEGAGGGVGAGM